MVGNPGYLYIILEREFLHSKQPVYKFGRTTNIAKRIAQYPKGSRLVYTEWFAGDHVRAEADILREFDRIFKQRADIGREYYECANAKDMIRPVRGYCEAFSSDYDGGGIDSDSDPNSLSIEMNPGTTVVNKAYVSLDPTLVVMDFVEEHKAALSGRTVKAKGLYSDYFTWAGARDCCAMCYTKFLAALKETFAVRVKAVTFPVTGLEQAAVFPNLMPRRSCVAASGEAFESVVRRFAFVGN